MNNQELIDGIDEINEWIFGVSDVSDEEKETPANHHIKHFYKVLDELRAKLQKEI